MCGASVGAALQLVGAYGSFLGQGAEADARAKSAEYQAAVDRNNALIAENNAKIAEARGADAEMRGALARENLARDVGQMTAQGRTGFAAGNVMVGSGSALAWEGDVAAGAARDRLAIDRDVSMEKWGYKVAAQNERAAAAGLLSSAGMRTATASNARAAGQIAQAGTLLGTASRFATEFTPRRKQRFEDVEASE